MCGTFQDQHRQRGILNIGISGLNVCKCFTGKGYGLIVLEECSTKAIFTGISLQDKGLCAVIISQSGPEEFVANSGLQAVEGLICGGVPAPIFTCSLRKVVLDARPWRKGCK